MGREKRSILVTGGGGYLGRELVVRLAQRDYVNCIVAVDRSFRHLPECSGGKVFAIERDISLGVDDLVASHEIDTVIHAAFLIAPHRDDGFARSVNIGATRRLLRTCAGQNVEHFIYLSSATVYGAHRNNRVPLMEGEPIRPNLFQYAIHKAEAEEAVRSETQSVDGMAACILRAAVVLGPGADNYIADTLNLPLAVAPFHANPMMQFMHIDDFSDAIESVILKRASGTYNLAGNDTIDWRQAMDVLGMKRIRMPDWVLNGLVHMGWLLKVQNRTHPAGLDLIRFSYEVSTNAARRDLNWEPKKSSEEAIRSFVDGRNLQQPLIRGG